jgi:RNA polymerase sigma-70 factor (ECF subfamily)
MSDDHRPIELDIDSYRGQIKKFFKYKRLSVHDIEDLEQEVICRMIENFARFKNRSKISTWLYSICRNVLYEFYRKQKHHIELRDVIAEQKPAKEVLFSIESEVDKLPPYLKVVYHKRFIQEMRLEDISKELSIPVGTIKYYVHIVKKMIKSSI